MSRPVAGLLFVIGGGLMATLAAALLLYTSAMIFTRSLLPALQVSEPALARAEILGMGFSGYWVVLPLLVYLLMGFVALALAGRQGRRARALWRADDSRE